MIAAPGHLLSLPEWVALPEDRDRVYELQEGVLIAGPWPGSPHQQVVGDIADDAPHFLAEQVLLAIEVIADGTRFTDTVIKPVEYARAGIPCYWAVDLGDPLSLVAYRLVDGRYQETATVTGMFETNEPFSLRVDVAALARRA